MKKRLFLSIIVVILLLDLFCFAYAEDADWSLCDLIVPKEAYIGETITVEYNIKTGEGEWGAYNSGDYSDLVLHVTPMIGFGNGANSIGQDAIPLDSNTGSCEVKMPRGTEVMVYITGMDNVTGRFLHYSKRIKLKQNPDYPVTFEVDSYLHAYGETITVNYKVDGLEELSDAEIWWGKCQGGGGPYFPINKQKITSSSGQDTYVTSVGESIVVFCLFGSDALGNPIYAQTKEIHVFPEHTHRMKYYEEKEATCTSSGHEEYWYCSICRAYYTDAEGKNYIDTINKIPPTGHELIKHDQVYMNDGTVIQEYWECSKCGKLYSDSNATKGIVSPIIIDRADLVSDFVTRCYQIILGRDPESEGLEFWTDKLVNGSSTAAEIINLFVNSEEFQNKNLSYGDQVEILYLAMLDRGSDPAGKAYWISTLNGGNPLGAIVNGFCNSPEFNGICNEYGIKPGSVDVGELKPPKEVPVVDMDKIRAFVTRCYQIILSRQPEPDGLNYWSNRLAGGTATAAEVINLFVYSEEFQNKHLSNADSVEVLYMVMLDRGSDPEGKAYWINELENGKPFGVIINCFCDSQEFRGICAEYGITPGSVDVASVTAYAEPENEEEIPDVETEITEQASESALVDERTEQARAFVTHCYQSALNRDPGAEEANYYTQQILSGQMTAKDVARAFTFSQEFQGKWTDSTAFVRVLYKLCLDRAADDDGLVYWTDRLANGETPATVFNALTENSEFVQVCAKYGVPAGVDTNAIREQEETAAAETETAEPASEFKNQEKIRAFVSRFYRDAMGREADEEGLNFFTGKILNGETTPKDVAKSIILSDEFRGKMPGNEELVKILYRVYLGREADEEGLANWVGELDNGTSLETVLNGFAGSEEFAAVVNGLK